MKWRRPGQPWNSRDIVTGKELFEARATLGMMWGRGQPIGVNELARALRLGKNGAASILKMEAGERPVSGPMSVAIEAMLAGFRPQDKGE
jgi:hypothetical protein